MLVVGVAGSGKTSLKHCLFGEEPPSIRCSTALAEATIQAISRVIVGTDRTGWFRITYDQLMEMLGGALKAGIPMDKTKVSSSDTPAAVAHSQLPKMDSSEPPKPSKRHSVLDRLTISGFLQELLEKMPPLHMNQQHLLPHKLVPQRWS